MTTSPWPDAVTAALVMAVDPDGTGIVLRGRAGPVRTRWLMLLRAALPKSLPLKPCPVQIADSRLLGGLDLDATLRSGRPVAAQGLLADADGGIVVLAMAERMPSSTAAHIAMAIDTGVSTIERDGLSLRMPARFGVVALDEGIDDEIAPASLRDRLAIHIDLDAIAWRDSDDVDLEAGAIDAARELLPRVIIDDDQISALCRACAALGIASLRTPMQALRVACAAAALAGRVSVDDDDIALAARLVLAPRATILPPVEQDASPPPPSEPPQDSDPSGETQNDPPPDVDRALDDVILEAAQAAIPADVLALLRAGAMRSRGRGAGKAGAIQASKQRGRPAGTRRGELRSGGRLNLIETLRTAAPWQRLRRVAATSARIIVRPEDVRLTRFRQRSETATIFVVDASGSAALHRLAEAKGAVELLLADCYVRRDQVALIAFRGTTAEVLLPPTRSLARAKRSLAGLPGGGGTPLAAGLAAAVALADLVVRKGQTPSVILLTDGRANIGRDGTPGRPQAEADATLAARALQAAGIASVLVDTSQRPGPAGAQLARDMGARYLPLPHADASVLAKAVKAVVG